ncbi:MAG: hypothetical protein HZA20_03840 [Nitrospirae bacterium]|nr:hypothetical protein [Nitrospirota bacterium]
MKRNNIELGMELAQIPKEELLIRMQAMVDSLPIERRRKLMKYIRRLLKKDSRGEGSTTGSRQKT